MVRLPARRRRLRLSCPAWASITVSFRLRGERERTRIQALLQLSSAYTGWPLYGFLLLILGAGILGGIASGASTSGQLWIWAGLVVLVAIVVAVYLVSLPHFNSLRNAVGLPTYDDVRTRREPPPPATDDELIALLTSNRPIIGAVVGFGGIVLASWLMMLKPF